MTKKKEMTPEDKELAEHGIFAALKQITQAKPEKSEYWGVLDRLNTSDEDLILKTDLDNPLPVAALYIIAEYINDIHQEFEKPANRLRNFLKKLMEARISHEGKGREGTLRVLENLGRNEDINHANEVFE